MSNPITTLPPEGEYVYVTDGAYQTVVAWRDNAWRDCAGDAGCVVFSAVAAWDTVPPPVVAQPPVVTVAPAIVAAEAAVQAAEAELNAAEAAAK